MQPVGDAAGGLRAVVVPGGAAAGPGDARYREEICGQCASAGSQSAVAFSRSTSSSARRRPRREEVFLDARVVRTPVIVAGQTAYAIDGSPPTVLPVRNSYPFRTLVAHYRAPEISVISRTDTMAHRCRDHSAKTKIRLVEDPKRSVLKNKPITCEFIARTTLGRLIILTA